jgi:hypothetical protein
MVGPNDFVEGYYTVYCICQSGFWVWEEVRALSWVWVNVERQISISISIAAAGVLPVTPYMLKRVSVFW